jgi:L-arabinose transport system permease protein
MMVIFVVLFIAASIWVDNFLTLNNMKTLLLQVVQVGIAACAMLFLLATGDFDLSPGAVVALSGVIAAVVTNRTGSVAIGFAAAIIVGSLVGWLNGVLVARAGISAMIATLGTQQIARGLTFITSDGKAVGVSNEGFRWIGSYQLFGLIPFPVVVMGVFFAVFGYLLGRTIFGRNSLAIGGNAEAAKLAGINVVRTRVIIFTLLGLCSAVAGVILASQMTSGQPNEGLGLELRVISACVLGGVSLSGGVGTMLGTIVGVLIMGMVQDVMNLLNIETFWQYVVSGAVLLAAVLIDRLKQRRAV